MTTQEKIAAIRQKCADAHGVLDGKPQSHRAYLLSSGNDAVRLADVLLAIDKTVEQDLCITPEGQFASYYPEAGTMGLRGKWWNLRKDDLTEQSQECVDFLYDLIK